MLIIKYINQNNLCIWSLLWHINSPTTTEPDYETLNCLTEYLIPTKIQENFYLTIDMFQFPKGKVKNAFSVAVSVKL